MSVKYLSGTYNAGYALNAAYTAVTLGGTGSIGGTGLVGNASPDTAVNLGDIAATTSGASGIMLQNGGTVINGSRIGGNTTAFISGAIGGVSGSGAVGVSVLGGIGITNNYGTIAGGSGGNDTITGGAGGAGITIANGGTVGNARLITGGGGGAATSSGGVGGAGGAGISLYGGGSIGNAGTILGGAGGAAPRYGGKFFLSYGIGGNGGAAVVLSGGGSLTNTGFIAGGIGGVADTEGPGGAGVVLSVGGSISNTGTIKGGQANRQNGIGIVLSAGGTVTNGGTSNSMAYIAGIEALGTTAATVTNFGVIGTIGGGNLYSVIFSNSSSVLTIEGNGRLFGKAIGGAGTLVLGAAGGNGYVPGFEGYHFKNFSQYIVVSGANWTTNNVGVVNGATLSDNGTLTVRASLLNQGVVNVASGATLSAVDAYVTNSGTITNVAGSTGTAISMNYAAQLLLEPGSRIIGKVVGGNLLKLLPGSGTISGLGSQYSGFRAYEVVSGGDWTVTGANTVASGATLINSAALIDSGTLVDIGAASNTGGLTIANGGTVDLVKGVTGAGTIAFSGTSNMLTVGAQGAPGTLGNPILGFAPGDTLDLAGIGLASSYSYSPSYAGGTLTLTNSSGTLAAVKLSTTFAHPTFTLANDAAGGTAIGLAPPCFCRGTLIRTPHGEIAVEDLAIGDKLVTLSGEARRVRWIGRRAYDGRFIAGKPEVLPIRIAAGALADDVPARELWLSPEHSLFIDGVLAQAKHLLNGMTISQAERVERVEYFHIELDAHDIIVAEGAPAETYVDCDNRLMFANAAEYDGLYPADDRGRWQFCAPRLEEGSGELAAIRVALMTRAAALGFTRDRDPDPHLVVDGATTQPDIVDGLACRFTIPAGSREVWLASRSVVPAEGNPGARDIRRLGLAIDRLVLWDDVLRIEVGHRHPGLCEGFHAAEADHRWTDGLARLPKALLRRFSGPFTLELHLTSCELPYPVPPPALTDRRGDGVNEPRTRHR